MCNSTAVRVGAGLRSLVRLRLLFATVTALLAVLGMTERAQAIPSFSRKYETSCQTCHIQYPVLNAFGEAFRRNGYRFPSQGGSVDSDAAKAETIAMGQPENADSFPNSVLPSQISKNIALSAVVNSSLPFSLPDSDLRKSSGNAINLGNLQGPISLYAAGSITDNITYFAKATILPGYSTVGPAYLLWNDVLGPRHSVNLWVGRLVAPQLTSFVSTGAYLADKAFPTVSVAALFNGNHSFVLGQGPSNGAELNGILWHRFAYSVGWLASSVQTGLKTPTSQDFYGHLGTKIGGGSLDGEEVSSQANVDLLRSWAETSLTFDVFAYRGLSVADNFTNYPTLTGQRNEIEAVGVATRLQLGSFTANVILQEQNHFRPYAGGNPTPANPPIQPVSLPGVPDNSTGRGFVSAAELSYVVFPWLVPAIRAERTDLDSSHGSATFSRLMPGVSALLRPNLRLYVYADMQSAYRTPPQPNGLSNTWVAASGTAEPPRPHGERKSVEAIVANVSFGF